MHAHSFFQDQFRIEDCFSIIFSLVISLQLFKSEMRWNEFAVTNWFWCGLWKLRDRKKDFYWIQIFWRWDICIGEGEVHKRWKVRSAWKDFPILHGGKEKFIILWSQTFTLNFKRLKILKSKISLVNLNSPPNERFSHKRHFIYILKAKNLYGNLNCNGRNYDISKQTKFFNNLFMLSSTKEKLIFIRIIFAKWIWQNNDFFLKFMFIDHKLLVNEMEL